MRGPGSLFRGRDRDYGRRNHRRDDYDPDDERLERAWSNAEQDYHRKADRFYQGDVGDDGFHRGAIVETVYRKPREYADLHEYDEIPVIDRVPTAIGYHSQDSAEMLNEEKSRASRYGVEGPELVPSPREEKKLEVKKSNTVEDDEDKYANAVAKTSASVWSDSTDSHAPMWRSYSDDEEKYMDRAHRPAQKREDRAPAGEIRVKGSSYEREELKPDQTDDKRKTLPRDPDGYRDAADEKRRADEKLRDVLSKRPSEESGKDERSDRSGGSSKERRQVKGGSNDDSSKQEARVAKTRKEKSKGADEPTLSMSRSDNDELTGLSKKKSRSKDESRDSESEISSKGKKKIPDKRKDGVNRFQSKRSTTQKLAMFFRGPGSRGSSKKLRGSKDKLGKKSGKKVTGDVNASKQGKSAQKEKESGKRVIDIKNSNSSSDKSSKKTDPSASRSDIEKEDNTSSDHNKEMKSEDEDDVSDLKKFEKVRSNRSKNGRGSSFDSYEDRKRNKSREASSQPDDDKSKDSSMFERKVDDSVRSDLETKDSSLPLRPTKRPEGLPDVSAMHLEDEPDWSSVQGDIKEKKSTEEPNIVTALRNNHCGAIATFLMAGVYTLDGIANLGYTSEGRNFDWGKIAGPGQFESSVMKFGKDEDTSQVAGSLNLDGTESDRAKDRASSNLPKHEVEESRQDLSTEVITRRRSRENPRDRDRSRRADSDQDHRRVESKHDSDDSFNGGRKGDESRRYEKANENHKARPLPGDESEKKIKNTVRGDGDDHYDTNRRGDEFKSRERNPMPKRDIGRSRVSESGRDESQPLGKKVSRDSADDGLPHKSNYGRKPYNGENRDEFDEYGEKQYEDSRGRGRRVDRSHEKSGDGNFRERREEDSPEHEGRPSRQRYGREPNHRRREDELERPGTPNEVRALNLDHDEGENYNPNVEPPRQPTIPSDCISVTSIEIPVLPSLFSNQDDEGSVSILGLTKPETNKSHKNESETGVPPVQLKKGKPSFIGKFLSRKKKN